MDQKHVPSLETCKRLLELGFFQESVFWWGKYSADNQFKGETKVCTDLHTADKVNYSKVCAAPLASELAELLPDVLKYTKKSGGNYLTIQHRVAYWKVGYVNLDAKSLFESVGDKNLSEAMAKMYIYLKEKGLL